MKIKIIKEFEGRSVGDVCNVELKNITAKKMVDKGMDLINRTLDIVEKEQRRLAKLHEDGIEEIPERDLIYIRSVSDAVLKTIGMNTVPYYQFDDGNYVIAVLEDIYFEVLN